MSRRSSTRRVRPGSILRILKRFRGYLTPYRRTLLTAFACMLGASAMELLRPWPLKIIFDGILMPQPDADPVMRAVAAIAPGDDLLLAVSVIAILAVAVIGGLCSFGQAYLIASVGQKVVAKIRHALYDHIQRLSHSFHDERDSGDLLARLTGDVQLVRDLMVNTIIYTTARVLMVVGTLTVMALMDWRLTLIALLVVPLLVLATGRFGRRIKGAAKRQRRKESQIAQVMTERISAVRVVQAYAREAHEEERFARRNASSAKAGLAATRLEAHLDRLVQIVLAAGTAGVVWYGVHLVKAGALTPGDLLVFAAYLATLYKPVRKLAAMTGRVAKATVCSERIVAILDIEPDIKDADDAIAAPPFRGEITFDDVTFAYKPERPVFENLNLTIVPGETLALLGSSGSGKSTIANLVLRFYDPVAGSVMVDGVDLRRFTLTSLRDQIAIVLQDSVLFNASVRENIAYGRLDATEEQIVAAARAANADEFIERLPEGYDTVIGERGAMLSGGQCQRIAIARAMVRDTPIVILDEPMAGLDADNEAAVREALFRLTADKTCLLITHDRGAVLDADRVLAFRGGSLFDVTQTREAS